LAKHENVLRKRERQRVASQILNHEEMETKNIDSKTSTEGSSEEAKETVRSLV
jgi:hypothetical protein